ncbi:MAG: hypothetical protein IE933_14600 [Sphingomonadales bacterium]|nr:hypothetical protein [Sphingomonadales bacterium]MBD3775196.1 hypothetical protein [Paracoccaceae bacterium]
MMLKNKIRDLLAPYPGLFIPLYRMLAPPQHKLLLIGPETEIVIEGYPRSANTFAVVAFEQAQGARQVKIAHHLHAEAQVLEAVRRGLPAIVLIRRPYEAIRSLKVAFPAWDENYFLRRYVDFNRAIARVRDRVVVAEFERTTKDFGGIIGEVNAKFGTDFALFPDGEEAAQAVFARIDEINAAREGAHDLIARPAAHKEKAKGTVSLDFDPAMLARAEQLYTELTGLPARKH